MALEIIDAHIHIAQSVERGTEVFRYHMGHSVDKRPAVPAYGTVEELTEVMKATGTAHSNFMMLTYSGRYYEDGRHLLPDDPTEREQAERELRARVVAKIRENNEWAVTLVGEHPNLSFFCGIDPVLMTEQELIEEVADKTGRGAVGVKMATTIPGSDRRIWPVYEFCHARALPMLTATNGSSDSHRPAHYGEALKAFPRLKIIFAHLGYDRYFAQGADLEVVDLAQKYEGVCSDLSIKVVDVPRGRTTPEDFVAHLRRVGTDRVLYASNFPYVEFLNYSMVEGDGAAGQPQMTGAKLSAQTLLSLPLTDDEREAIAGKNFRRITGLKAKASPAG